jgi:hypothetical protein
MVTKTSTKLKPVVVTTENRGVFFGYAELAIKDEITLKDARMCVYWSSNVKGILGLAYTGPLSGCKISPPAPSIILNKVTSVMECTKEAAEAWEKNTWG